MHNFYETPICMGKERIKDPKHPAQKPVKLLKHLINISTDEGDLIYDPFMGIGSTAVAAAELNRSFIGCEIEPVYYNGTKKRLSDLGIDYE